MKVAVIGGGMLGLSLAEQAASSGADVALYEAADHLGGLAAPWRLGGVIWDRHYHVTLASDAYLRALLRRLDLENKVVWKKTRTGAFVGGRVHPASNGVEFLLLPGLNVIDKARVVATMLAGSRTAKETLESQTAEAWLRRWSGDGGYERFWEPLLRSKLGDAHRHASASFIGATIERLSSARCNEFGEERFGYVPGGYAVVVDRYAQRLRNLSVRIRTSAPVRSIRRKENGLEIVSSHGVHMVDRVIVTTPAPVSASICPDLGEEERRLMKSLRYQGIVCAALLCSRPLSPYYVTNLIDAGLPFTGVIEMTALVDPQAFGGSALLYLPKYAAPDDPIFDEDDASVEKSFLAGLRRIHPSLRDEDIRAFRVSRVRQVFTIPTIEYSRNLPPMRTSVEGLYVVNGAHIVGGTLNVNETLALSERAFALLMEGGNHVTSLRESLTGSR